MSKPKHIQISIPHPCSQNWDEMTPAAKGRHCAQCQKTVIDFTGWSDAALYNYFANNTGNVCGRVTGAQLNRTIDIPYQPHSRLYRLTIALGLTLTLSQTPQLTAQTRPPWLPAHCIVPAKDTSDCPGVTLLSELRGAIVDERNEPLINAIVQVLQHGVLKGGAVANYDGLYVIKDLESGFYDIVVQYMGYDSIKLTGIKISTKEIKQQNFQLSYPPERKLSQLGGCIVVTRYVTPILNIDNPTTRIITRDQIDHMPH